MKMSNNLAKYEVLIKQYLCSILDISERWKTFLRIQKVVENVK